MKKRTFQKAGAAVLSMAMLLSFGAIGATTAYATEPVINQVTVTLKNSSGAALTDGTVNVYQVAYVDGNGDWKWNGTTPSIKDDDGNTKSVVFKGATSGQKNIDDLSNTELNRLALVLSKDTTNYVKDAYKVGTGTTGTSNPITLTTVAGTADVTKRAYYLIVTAGTGNNSGIVVQPTLKEIDGTTTFADGTATAEKTVTTALTAKSNPLPITKQITAITNGDVSGTGNTSVGKVGSKVSYQIVAQLPSYDSDVTGDKIADYIINDDPSSGIAIDTDNFDATGSNVKVVISTDTIVDGEDIVLYGGTVTEGYSAKVAVAANSSDGFKVTLKGTAIKDTGVDNQGSYVIVTFDAEVDTDAVLANGHVTDYDTAHNSTTGNPNTAHLIYGNNYSTGGYANPDDEDGEDYVPDTPDPEDPTKPEPEDNPNLPNTPSNTVTTYIGEIDLQKYGKVTNDPDDGDRETLNGAGFTLYKNGQVKHTYDDTEYDVYVGEVSGVETDVYSTDDGTTWKAVSDDNDVTVTGTPTRKTQTEVGTYTTSGTGKFDFGYLAAGSYTLKETTVPNNYKTAGDFTFTVTTDNDTNGEYDTYEVTGTRTDTVSLTTTATGDYTIEAIDEPVDSLPGTGGMGTILFTVGGAAIVLLAGTMFVIYMKKRKVEE